ncbi:Abi family protein [Paenibacillus rhizoplanae]
MEKHYTTLRGRLDKLRERGMSIPKDKEKERGVIKRYNYYNLVNAYKDPFLTDRNNYPAHADPNEDYYLLGTTPSHLEALYIFDEKLRRIFLERILVIEEHLKDVIVQSFYEHHTDMGKKQKAVNILHRESEYLRRNYYDLTNVKTYVVTEKSGHKYTVIGTDPGSDNTKRGYPRQYLINKDEIYHSFIAILYKQIGQQRKKNKSISSYLDKHTYLPMWILTNIMTFGNVSKLFEILTSDVQLLV